MQAVSTQLPLKLLSDIPMVILGSILEYLSLQDQTRCLRLSNKLRESIQKILDHSSWIQQRLEQEWGVTLSPCSLKKAATLVRAHQQGTLQVVKFGQKHCPIEQVVAAGNRILALGETSGWLLDHQARKIADLSSLLYSNQYLENYCITADATHLLVRGLKGLKIVELQTGQVERQISSLQGQPFSIHSNRLLLVKDTKKGVSLEVYDWPLKEEIIKTHSIVLPLIRKPHLAVSMGTDCIGVGMDYAAAVWRLSDDTVTSLTGVDRVHAMYPWPDTQQVVISDAAFYRSSAKVSLFDVETGSNLRCVANAQYDGVIDMLKIPDGRLSTYTYISHEVQLHDDRSPKSVGKLLFPWAGITAAVGFGPYFWTSYSLPPLSSVAKGTIVCWDMRHNKPVRELPLPEAFTIQGSLQEGDLVGRVKHAAVVVGPRPMKASFEKGSLSRSWKRNLFP